MTVADDLTVEIETGCTSPTLAHSGWRDAVVLTEGESLALSTGLQAALWRPDGVQEEHRTDSISATFSNLRGQPAFHVRRRLP